jgi:hypothetical protein
VCYAGFRTVYGYKPSVSPWKTSPAGSDTFCIGELAILFILFPFKIKYLFDLAACQSFQGACKQMMFDRTVNPPCSMYDTVNPVTDYSNYAITMDLTVKQTKGTEFRSFTRQ